MQCPPGGRLIKRARWTAVAAVCAFLPAAQAGPLGLPVPQPGPVLRDAVERVRDTANKAADKAADTLDRAVSTLATDPAGRPVDPTLFEKDENGARVVRGVVIAIGLSDRGRNAAETLGIDVARVEDLDPLDIEVAKLRLPPDMSASEAIASLRAADPVGAYDFEHVYDPAGHAAASPARAFVAPIASDEVEIGMIDAGIERTHPALADAGIVVETTTERRGASKPTAHGTAIASLIVGDDGTFRGALPGATLYAADAFAGSPTGGSAADIARAIAWLVEEDVPVVNISVAGPRNALLEAAVRAAVGRGHVIVAPVGNDGPAAQIRYPAAYEGVIAVTSVDGRGHVQIDANRGRAVAFAASGVGVSAARLPGGYGAVTGTSFASPVVAARFAELLPHADAARARAVRDALAAAAANPARDTLLGYGILSPPGGVHAARR